MPVVVTQAPGGGAVLQNPVQHIFQQFGQQPPPVQSNTADVTQVDATSFQASSHEGLRAHKPVAPPQGEMVTKTVPVATESQEEAAVGAAASQQSSTSLENPRPADTNTAVPVPKLTEADCATVAEGAGGLLEDPEHSLEHNDIIELIIMGNELDDSACLQNESELSFAEGVILAPRFLLIFVFKAITPRTTGSPALQFPYLHLPTPQFTRT